MINFADYLKTRDKLNYNSFFHIDFLSIMKMQKTRSINDNKEI